MTVVMVWVHEYQCIMKKAPRFRSRDGRSNCNGESGAKEPQKDIGKSAREKITVRRNTSPQGGNSNELRRLSAAFDFDSSLLSREPVAPLQKFPKCRATMAVTRFLFRAEFGKCFLNLRKIKQRICLLYTSRCV